MVADLKEFSFSNGMGWNSSRNIEKNHSNNLNSIELYKNMWSTFKCQCTVGQNMDETALHTVGLHAKTIFSYMCLYNQIIRKRIATNVTVSEMIIMC